MPKRKLLPRTAALSAATMAIALTVVPAQAKELTFAYFGANKGPVAESMNWWADEVAKRTNGDLTVKFFWRQSLVKFPDTLASVESGLADMGELAAAFSKGKTPLWWLADTGSHSSDPYAAGTAFKNVRDRFAAVAEEEKRNGVKYVYHYSWGSVALLGIDRPYNNPSQFSGEKMRFSSMLTAASKAEKWDTIPVGLKFSELFSGLQKGVVNGGSSYLNQILPARINEVIKHVTEINQGQHTGVVVMNQSTWDGLSPAHKAVLDTLQSEMMTKVHQTIIEENDRIRAALKNDTKFPVTIQTVSAADSEIWGNAMEKIYNQRVATVGKKFPQAQEFATSYLSEIDRIAAKIGASGYPWK